MKCLVDAARQHHALPSSAADAWTGVTLARFELLDCITARILDQLLGCVGSDIQRPDFKAFCTVRQWRADSLRSAIVARASRLVAQRLAYHRTQDRRIRMSPIKLGFTKL
jgi:hypothetical protein